MRFANTRRARWSQPVGAASWSEAAASWPSAIPGWRWRSPAVKSVIAIRLLRHLVDHLDVRRATAERVTDPSRTWAVMPGRFTTAQAAPLAGLHGVYAEREFQRIYPRNGLARSLLGTVRDGVGLGGVEQFMDSVLAGRAGRQVVARDYRGREIPGRVLTVQPAAPGRDIVLTIDQDLQAIAAEVLRQAIDSTRARGGDVVITDPTTGEILAMTSVVDDTVSSLSAIHTPSEPGSTIKPFTSAALLGHGVATLDDSVDTGDGRWQVGGRTITDTNSSGWLTLREVLKQSSNVGIAKFADRLTHAQQYRNLVNFGFGTPTGIGLPGEAGGILRPPERWSGTSRHSLAFGYELAATPLQVAMAFGALANGGWLMEPLLVKEVHDIEGRPVRFGQPRVVRRAVRGRVPEMLSPALVEVVESGTGTGAHMSTVLVAGKSGTARAFSVGAGYETGSYHASFGAYFPAEAPQLLIFVRLDRPQGQYFGGATAAPVTKAAMESLLSARQSPIDQNALAQAWRRPGRSFRGSIEARGEPVVRFAARGSDPDIALPSQEVTIRTDRPVTMTVPDLKGSPMRVALRRLHKMGLRIRVEGAGGVRSTVPGPGGEVWAGDTVLVVGHQR